ncbi:MAG TPA: CPBP family intramembrane glutamic endopeptidase [Flavisolibacter sp.]|nr:CPBP family intramembrane glutamic endopeptidase [Flavisolibacter sp.]
MQTYLKSKPVWMQLLLFMGMALGIFMFLSFIGLIILSKTTGISLLQLQNVSKWNPDNPAMIGFIRGMLLIQFLGLFLIPAFIFAKISDPEPARFLGLKKPDKYIYIILGIAIMIVAIPVVEFTGMLNQHMTLGPATQKWMKSMEEDAAKQIQFMLNKHTPSELFLNLIFISLFAGIGEEIFFRGVLQRLFIRAFKNPFAGIIVTAIIFSGFHLQFFGFIPRVLLGIILGTVYWYSGSLWTAIIAHFVYDGLIIVLAYFQPSIIKNPDAPIFDPGHLILPVLLSAIFTSLLIYQMKKLSVTSYASVYKNDQPQPEEFTF